MTAKKVLIVIDMQNDFIDGSLGTPEAHEIVGAVVSRIREVKDEGGTVIATMDTHTEDYLNTREGKYLPVRHCIKPEKGWQLCDPVAEALEGCTIVEKPTFGSLQLPDLIREKAGDGALDLELAGLCTDICVVSNALILKATFPEAELTVNGACCAGVTPEKHAAALETMRSCQIRIL